MIRPALPEEIEDLCRRITAFDPWKRLGIEGKVMAAAWRNDAKRLIWVWSEHGAVDGAIAFRVRHYAETLFGWNLGQQLAEHFDLEWPCEWSDLPDGGYISCLAVFENAQGRGIGSNLISAAEEVSQLAGLDRMTLMVSDFNERAQQFYQRHGYKKIAFKDDCIRKGNRELIMEKKLQQVT